MGDTESKPEEEEVSPPEKAASGPSSDRGEGTPRGSANADSTPRPAVEDGSPRSPASRTKPLRGLPKPLFDEPSLFSFLSLHGAQPVHYSMRTIWEHMLANPSCPLDEIPGIPANVRGPLRKEFKYTTSSIEKQVESSFWFRLRDGDQVEAIMHPESGQLFISSQSNRRNLSSGEIQEQLVHARTRYSVTHVTFMGMGEPLKNYDCVVQAIRGFVDKRRFAMEPRNITVSTMGIVGNMRRLVRDAPNINLTVAMDGPTQAIRERLIPLAKTFKLGSLMDTIDEYARVCRGDVKMSYVLHAGVNDSDACAAQLYGLVKGRSADVEVVYEVWTGSEWEAWTQVQRLGSQSLYAKQPSVGSWLLPKPRLLDCETGDLDVNSTLQRPRSPWSQQPSIGSWLMAKPSLATCQTGEMDASAALQRPRSPWSQQPSIGSWLMKRPCPPDCETTDLDATATLQRPRSPWTQQPSIGSWLMKRQCPPDCETGDLDATAALKRPRLSWPQQPSIGSWLMGRPSPPDCETGDPNASAALQRPRSPWSKQPSIGSWLMGRPCPPDFETSDLDATAALQRPLSPWSKQPSIGSWLMGRPHLPDFETSDLDATATLQRPRSPWSKQPSIGSWLMGRPCPPDCETGDVDATATLQRTRSPWSKQPSIGSWLMGKPRLLDCEADGLGASTPQRPRSPWSQQPSIGSWLMPLRRPYPPPDTGHPKPLFDEPSLFSFLSLRAAQPVHNMRKIWGHMLANPDCPLDQIPGIPESICGPLQKEFKFTTSTMSKVVGSNFLIRLHDGDEIEAVLDTGSGQLSVSSQSNRRKLSSGEIQEQLVHARVAHSVTSVSFIGMDEPLENYECVVQAIRGFIDKDKFALEPDKITVSTVGIVGNLRRLARDVPTINLAVAIHAPTQELREKLTPMANIFKLSSLMDSIDEYARICSGHVKISYVLLAGVNDSEECAFQLRDLVKGRLATVEVIPCKAPSSEAQAAAVERVNLFKRILGSSAAAPSASSSPAAVVTSVDVAAGNVGRAGRASQTMSRLLGRAWCCLAPEVNDNSAAQRGCFPTKQTNGAPRSVSPDMGV